MVSYLFLLPELTTYVVIPKVIVPTRPLPSNERKRETEKELPVAAVANLLLLLLRMMMWRSAEGRGVFVVDDAVVAGRMAPSQRRRPGWISGVVHATPMRMTTDAAPANDAAAGIQCLIHVRRLTGLRISVCWMDGCV